jgi:hypothetical protein
MGGSLRLLDFPRRPRLPRPVSSNSLWLFEGSSADASAEAERLGDFESDSFSESAVEASSNDQADFLARRSSADNDSWSRDRFESTDLVEDRVVGALLSKLSDEASNADGFRELRLDDDRLAEVDLAAGAESG